MTHCNKCCTAIIIIFFLLLVLSGCVHQQSVQHPYPRWGEEIHINPTNDAASLILRVIQPTKPTQAPACLLFIHGMNEYIGRYHEIAHHFSQRFTVAGFDLYAHGLSNPALQQADQVLTEDKTAQDVSDAFLAQAALHDLEPMRHNLDLALKHLATICNGQDGSDKPIFIVAHSLGALVAASYLLSADHEENSASRIQGIVLLGPAFAVSKVPGWLGWFANPLIMLSFHAKEHFLHPQNEPLPLLIINQIVSLITVPLLDGLFEVLSWPGLRGIFTPTSPGWVVDYLTDSAQEKARIRADGWIIRRTLLRYVKGIETEIVDFRRHMSEFAIPYYLIYSEKDPITPSWGNQDFAQATLMNHPDNELLFLPDMRYHQHLFTSQPLRSRFFTKIEQWLDKRLLSLENQSDQPFARTSGNHQDSVQ